jgi:hypothetical protein
MAIITGRAAKRLAGVQTNPRNKKELQKTTALDFVPSWAGQLQFRIQLNSSFAGTADLSVLGLIRLPKMMRAQFYRRPRIAMQNGVLARYYILDYLERVQI